MTQTRKPRLSPGTTTAQTVRRQIETQGERVWRFVDFDGMPMTAVAQALSRLTRRGVLQRLGKGLYYHPRQTAFGPSKPNHTLLRSIPVPDCSIFPAGIAAANLLGFTTQNPARVEVSTNGTSLPRLIVGHKTIVHTHRPESWRDLSETDAALLDFLRNRGASSELSSDETIRKLLDYFRDGHCFKRLLKIAATEPPRVRAMLGAIGEQLGCSARHLTPLRKSLNRFSRFDFGRLDGLAHARDWQAKECKDREAV